MPDRRSVGGQVAQVVDGAEVVADGPVVHHRVAAVVRPRPRLEQRHQVQVGDAELGQVVDLVPHPGEVAGEHVGVGGVAQHPRVLVPLRVGVPTQVQQPQVLGSLAEVARGDLGGPLGHLDRVVGVGAGETGQQVRPVALQAGLRTPPGRGPARPRAVRRRRE